MRSRHFIIPHFIALPDSAERPSTFGPGARLRIEARAPTRIDLAGGTLDIWPLYLFHPGALTVNCAITRYASCVIETQSGGPKRGSIRLVSRDTRREESFSSLAVLERARSYRLPLL